MKELLKVKLGELVDFQTGPFGTQFSASEYVEEGIPVINVKNIGVGEVIAENLDYISEETRDRLSQHILREGDIVFGRKGSVDRHAYIMEKEDGWVQGSDCIRARRKAKINTLFLSQYLESKSVKKQIMDSAVGSTMPSLNTDILRDILVLLPTTEEQDSIAFMLKKVNDKISLNKKINDNLQQMAKTIYDYWFTQFDFPNECGNPYSLSNGQMVWNETAKQNLPLGWSCSKMENAIENVRTGLNPRDNFKLGSGSIKYITVKNLRSDGVLDFSGCDTIDEAAQQIVHRRSDVSVGDILFASIAPLGRCYLVQEAPQDWDINESVFSIRYNKENVTPEYLYMHLQSEAFVKESTACSTGSIFKGIRINSLLDSKIIVPPMEIIEGFSKEVCPLFAMQNRLNKESHTLIQLRDWLLPMLMNGQATISD